jgi:hypothetical protein
VDLWMFVTTAIVFTACGWFFRFDRDNQIDAQRITQQTIDTLIEMGFLKVIGEGKDSEMIRWPEEDILFLEEEEEDDTRSS